MKEKIILTDWPKEKPIEANYRGVSTERLVDIHKSLYHSMMMSCHERGEDTGGYSILYGYKGVMEELRFRNAVPEGYEWRKT